MAPLTASFTVSGILFGFLFAAFWWSLNRELSFQVEQRHLKLGHLLLLVTLAILGYSGIIRPLGFLAAQDPVLELPYRGIVLTVVGVLGYALTEFGHYSVFQKAKYRTPLEWTFFSLTVLSMFALVLHWILAK